MCGIAGYYGQGNKNILEEMCKTLHHRGPDDTGVFLHEKIGLGHKRLSILDLSPAGHQPMSNEDESVWIVFNGEIYNYKELSKSLKQTHTFRSGSDTEVIIHLYEEIGEKVFSLIDGMFAIALYDKKKDTLFLARDRMGKKPLYYGEFAGTYLFASELKAFHKHPAFEKKIDKLSLKSYLFYDYVPSPASIFEGVSKLEPATYLKLENKKASKHKFWEISFDRGERDISMDEAMKRLDKTIEKAVVDRLVSDAPLGVTLSGGIDSSAVLYYAQKNSSKKIKTFSIGFEESSFDESSYARRVADHLGSDHHEEILSAQDSLDIIDKLPDVLDEPMADQSILPTYLLSKFVQKHVTVALGGDGGDEVFAGYVTFVAHKLAQIYARVPHGLRKNFIEKAITSLPTSFSSISLDFKLKSFIAGFDGDKYLRDARWMSSFDTSVGDIFSSAVREEMQSHDEFSFIEKYLEDFSKYRDTKDKDDFFRLLTVLYLRMYMMDQVMVKVDRASMANSIETRAPLLDTRVVDLALSLPFKYKLKPLTLPYIYESKYIFRKLMQDRLPHDIVWRPKKGFGVPVAAWLNGPLKPKLDEYLSKDRLEKQGLFSYDYIEIIRKEHSRKTHDHRKKLWNMLMFQMWYERWM